MSKKHLKKRVLFVRSLAPLILGLLGVALAFFYSSVFTPTTAYAASNSTINFQARLLNSAGAVVPDGNYNVEFKLYNSATSSGSSQGSCSGDSNCLWVETYTGANVVRVSDGYLTVNLGSINPFPSTINWDQNLWLGMNVGGTGTPSWDGEMSPRLQVTAVPYALSAQSLTSYNSTSGYTSSLQFTTPTANNTLTLPNASGVICLDSSSACGFTTGSGAGVLLQGTSPGTPQTGNINISGTAIAGNLEAGGLDTATSGTLTIGQTNATGVTIDQNTTLAAGTGLTMTGGTSFPVSPSAGEIYYRSDLGELFTYENGQWQADPQTATEIVTSAQYSSNYQRGNYVVPSGSVTANTVIQSAINALPSSGGVVYLAEGTYTLSAGITLPSNVSLVGSGATTTTLILKASLGGSAPSSIVSSTGTAVQVSNLTIDGNYSNGNSSVFDSGIYYDGTFHSTATADQTQTIKIANVIVQNVYDQGVYLYEAFNASVSNSDFYNNQNYGIEESSGSYVTVSGNDLEGNGSGSSTEGAIYFTGGSNNNIEDNSAEFNNANGQYAGIYVNNEASDVISGNDSSYNGRYGMIAYNMTYATVSGNVFNHDGLEGLYMWESDSYDNITGNTADYNPDYGIGTLGGTNDNWTSNDIEGNGFEGIIVTPYYQSISNMNISGNLVTDNGSNGISAGSLSYGTISNNNLINNQGPALEVGGDTNVTITGNSITSVPATATLTTNLTNASTTIQVNSDTGFPGWVCGNDYVVQIGSEDIQVSACGDGTTTWTIANRGYNSTTEANHSSGATVTEVLGNAAMDGNTTNSYISNNVYIGSGQTGSNNSGSGNNIDNQLNSSGSDIFENGTNSTSAYQFQNSSATTVLDVDTTDQRVGIGTASPTGTLSVVNASGLSQTAVFVNQQNTGQNILQAQSNGTTVATIGGTGATTFENSSNSTTAFQVQNASGNNILDVDTSNNQVVLGKSSTLNGQLEFNNSTNTNTVTIVSGVTANSYTLTLPTQIPSTGLCLQTSTAVASQLIFASCANTNASITEVSEWDGHGSNTTTLNVAPVNVGDILVMTTQIPTASDPVMAVSGGGVTTWRPVIASAGNGTVNRVEMWIGSVTTAGSSTITVTYTSNPGTNEITASEYTAAGVSGNTTWGVDADGSQLNSSPSTTVTYPAITSEGNSELYVGYAQGQSAGSAGSTTGFSYIVTGQSNIVTYATPTVANNIYQPTSHISSSGESNTIGAIITAFVSSTGINNSTSLQQANFYVQAASSGSVAGVLQANSGGSSDILDLRSGTGTNVVTVGDTGNTLVEPSANSATAFQVQNASASPILTADTSNGRVDVGPTDAADVGSLNVVSSSYQSSEVTISDGETSAPPTYPSGILPALSVQVSEVSGSRPLFFGYNNGSGGYAALLTAGACGSFTQMCLDLGSGGYDTALESSGTTLDVGGGADGYFSTVAIPTALDATGTATFEDGTNSATAFEIQNSSSSSLLNVNSTNGEVGIDNAYAAMSAPTGLTVYSPIGGGNLTASTTYYYKVTALDDGGGQTVASIQASGATTSSDKTLLLGWSPVSGAAGYDVYRSTTSGSEVYLTTVLTNSFEDYGDISPQTATPPSTGTAYHITSSTNNNDLQLSVGGNGTPTGQVYVSGTIPSSYLGSISTVLGSGADNPNSVFVQGDYAYVSDLDGFGGIGIYNIANPNDPMEVGYIAADEYASTSIYVQGDYLYATDEAYGDLVVYNVSNPADPTIAGTVNLDGDSPENMDIYVSGRYAYITNYDSDRSTGYLYVVDISNPTNPIIVGTNTDLNRPDSLYVSGSYAYVGDYGTLDVLDISDPTNPSYITDVTLDTDLPSYTDVYVQGSYAYVSNCNEDSNNLELYTVNISNPNDPLETGTNGFGGCGSGSGGISVQGRYAYFFAGTGSVEVADVSNPADPQGVGTIGAGLENPSSIFISGRYAYVTDFDENELYTYDLGGEYTQELQAGSAEVSTLSVDGDSMLSGDASIQGGLTVGQSELVNGNLGASTVNIGGDGTPVEQLYVGGSLPTSATGSYYLGSPHDPNSIYVSGSYTYLTDSDDGTLKILDTSNPADPVFVSSTSVGSSASPNSVYVSGHYAYVTDNTNNKLVIFDVSNPTSPTNVGSVSTGGSSEPNSVYVQGRYAYVTTYTNGLNIYDVSKPTAPVLVGSVSESTFADHPQAVWVTGRYAYVTLTNGSDTGFLAVVDISNPASPSVKDQVSSGDSNPVAIYVSGDYAYIASNRDEDGDDGGLMIYNISNPSSVSQTSYTDLYNDSMDNSISVQGRYAYLSDRENGTIDVVDISNPYSPAAVGNGIPVSNPTAIFVQGNYVYETDIATASVNIYNIGGEYTQQLQAGGIETGTLQVDTNANVNGDESIGGGLNVGQSLNVSGASSVQGALSAYGTATFSDTTNSTSAFQVENSSGSSLLTVNTSGNSVTIDGNDSGAIPSWTTESSPASSSQIGTAVANGYLYTAGGYNYYLDSQAINANGSLGTNNSVQPLPTNPLFTRLFSANGYLYAIYAPGSGAASGHTAVYSAPITANGGAGAFQLSPNYISPSLTHFASLQIGDYLYVFGGYDGSSLYNTVWYTQLNANGTIGAWNTTSSLAFSQADETAVAANGYVYLTGGYSSSVYYAPVNSNGTLGSWTSSTSIPPSCLADPTSVVENGYWYVMGGNNCSSTNESTVYYAPLNANGTVGSWTTNATPLPTALYFASSFVNNGYIYFVGGYNGSSNPGDVYYGATQTTNIYGSLNLVATAQNLGSGGDASLGSAGGSLTAGDTTVDGSLQVQGQTLLAGGLGVSGPLDVNNSANFENTTNSTTAFQVQNSSDVSLFTVDTTDSLVTVNANETLTAGSALTITGSGSFPSSPTAGELYYRTDLKELFVYENGQWQADPQTATEIVTSANASTGSSNYERGNYVVPSGSTTAQTVINSAISALPSSGGVVYLAEGTYTTTAPITLPSNVSLIGSGNNSTIITATTGFSGSGVVATSTNATNDQVSNLGINGDSGLTYGFYLNNPGGTPPTYSADTSAGIQILDVAETGGYYGVWMDDGGDNVISQSTFDSNTYYGIYSYGGEYDTFLDNTVQNNGHSGYTYGVGIFVDAGSHNKIEGNSLDWNNIANYGFGLWLDYEIDDVVSGNDMSHSSWAGLYGQGSTTSAADNTISGNTANDNSDEGIDFETGSYESISGNTTNNNADCGIRSLGGLGANISSNITNYNGFEGICVVPSNSAVDDSVINGNTVDYNGSTGIIYTANYGQITGNTITNNQGGSIGSTTFNSPAPQGLSMSGNDNTVTGNTIMYSAGTATTTLSGAITCANQPGATSPNSCTGPSTLVLNGTTGFPQWSCGNSFVVQIDSEDIKLASCGDTSGAPWTASIQDRGYNGTTAATHSNGATITWLLPAGPSIYISSGSTNYMSNNIDLGTSSGPITDSGTGTIYAGELDSSNDLIEKVTNSTTGFQVQNNAGTSVLTVDTINSKVTVGGDLNLTNVAAPGALTATGTATTGNPNGTYYYCVTYLTALGQTNCGTDSSSVTVSSKQISLTNIPISSSTLVTGRDIYRTQAGGGYYQLLTTIGNNTSTTYTDNTADGSLSTTDAPTINSTGGIVTINGATALIIDTANSNIGIGVNSLPTNNIAVHDIAIGSGALENNGNNAQAIYGSDVIAIGYDSGENSYQTGGDVGVGSYSLQGENWYGGNTAIGEYSLQNDNNADDTALGFGSGTANYGGADNTYIGFDAGNQDPNNFSTGASLTNATAIGNYAQVQASNSLVLGDSGSNAVNVGIGTTIPLNTLSVSPVRYSTGTASQSGYTVTGSGTSWTTAMVGEEFIFASGGEGIINSVNSGTSITLSVSLSEGSQNYRIQYIGLQVASNGDVGIGTYSPTVNLQIGSNGTANGQVYVSGNVPTSPLGTLSSTVAQFVVTQGNYVYTLSSTATLGIDNITNPASVTSVTTLSLGSGIDGDSVNNIAVEGNYVYAGTSNSLKVVNVSNPDSPTVVDTIALGGGGGTMYIQGRYLYVVQGSSQLDIYDISNPAVPVFEGSAGSNVNDIVVQGNYVYYANWDSCALGVINVSNPTNPTFVTTISDGSVCNSGPYALAVSGDYVYMADSESGGQYLYTYNITNAATPTLVGGTSIDAGADPDNVVIQGLYAYVTVQDSDTIDVFSLNNPSSAPLPRVGTILLADNPTGMAIDGRYAYVAADGVGHLYTYDLGGTYTQALQAGSTETGTLQVDNNASIQGSEYIEGGVNVGQSESVNGNLGVGGTVNIGGNGTPTSQLYVSGNVASTTYSTSNQACANDLYGEGAYIYTVNSCASPNTQFKVLDASNPGNVVALSTVSLPGGTSANPWGVYAQGHYAYVVSRGTNTMSIIDVSSPYAPVVTSTIATGTTPIAVYVTGNYAYVVNNGSNTLQIINISNPYDPVNVSGIYTGTPGSTSTTQPYDVFVQGRYAYVVNQNSTMYIFDVSNPVKPVEVNSVNTGNTPLGVYVSGDYAYVVNNYGNSLQTINVSNPASPSVTGTVSLGSSVNPQAVWVQGRYAYTVNYNETMSIVDVSTPSNPALVGSVPIGSGTGGTGLYVNGRYAYMSGTTQGVSVVDLGGEYAQQLQAGGIETGTLQVDTNANISGDTSIEGGLSVGQNASFTGNATFSGTVTQQNQTNSTTAFNVQNSSAGSVLTADTTDNAVDIDGYADAPIVANEHQSAAPLGALGGTNPGATYVPGQYTILTNNLTSSYGTVTYRYTPPVTPDNLNTTFDLYSNGGADSIYWYAYNTSVPSTESTNAGGYVIAFDEYSAQIQVYWQGTDLYNYSISNLGNGTWRTAQISISSTDLITVGLNGSTLFTYQDSTRSLSGTYFGYGGRSGGISAYQYVRNMFMQFTPPQTLAVAGSVASNGLTLSVIPTPAAPTVTPTCSSSCTTSYSYAVAAVNSSGTSPSSTATSTSAAGATLSGTVYNTVTWNPVVGATSYNIYRTASSGTPSGTGLIGTVAATSTLSFADIGITASGSSPTVNTTGSLTVNGSSLFEDSTNSSTAFNIQNSSGTNLLTVNSSASQVVFGASATTNNSFVFNESNGFFGVYSGGITYGIGPYVPGPAGFAEIGGYYQGLAIAGNSNGTGSPIFGVLNNAQSSNGLGHTAITVYDNNVVDTYNNILDDGSGNVVIAGTTTTKHLLGSSGTPTYTAGAGAGGSPTVTITGNDIGGLISVATSGTAPTGSNAIILTVTFHTAYGSAPYVTLTPNNANAAALSGATEIYATSTTATFVLTSGTTALSNSTTYTWYYHVTD